MSLTIMRRIRFCAGHRLYRHGGKCEFFHGHNYVAEFYVTGEATDDVGRVLDFADLKQRFKGWIDEQWDHGFLLHAEDENGIAAAKSQKPDVILLDVMMTTKDEGFNVARELQSIEGIKGTPVIMVTGVRREMNLPFGFEPDATWLPVKQILEKPVKPETLLAAVTDALK